MRGEVEQFFKDFDQFVKIRKAEAAKFELMKTQAGSSTDRPAEEEDQKKKSAPSGSSSTFELLDAERTKGDSGEEC